MLTIKGITANSIPNAFYMPNFIVNTFYLEYLIFLKTKILQIGYKYQRLS
jgi:hypothetical protein